MNLLLDQDVYEITARLLIQSGHDVRRARELGLSRADDVRLLAAAHEHNRILPGRHRIRAFA